VRRTLLLAAVLAIAGCGGEDGNPNAIMRETAASLSEIKSAKPFKLRIAVDPRDGDEFGFAIDGAVALCDGDDELPRLDVAYTQFAQGKEAVAQLISTGSDSFIEIEGTAYVLPDAQEAELRNACKEVAAEGGLEQLRVDDWVLEPRADGDNAVHGRLNVVAVINDLVDVARAFGGSTLSRLDSDDARRIAEATEESSFELERGDDGLLRRLALEADLGFDVPRDLQDALGKVVGAKVTFELDLDDPNTEVEVSPPPNPRPASQLPRSNR
jgi:hypothetical protein